MIVALERSGLIRRQAGATTGIEILVAPENLLILNWLVSNRQNHCDEPLVRKQTAVCSSGPA